jgi:hypothetical protein
VTAAAIRAALACGDSRCSCSHGRHVHCPAHSDRHPSFAVDERHGRVLVVCRAGCDQRDVLAALARRGLWSTAALSATFPTKRAPTARDLALNIARTQPWLRLGVLDCYCAADAYRCAMGRVQAIRVAATRAGDVLAAWEALTHAARIETAACALAMALEEVA